MGAVAEEQMLVGHSQLHASGEAIARAVAELECATDTIRSRQFAALFEQATMAAAARANSPWVDRAGAAAYCYCSVSEIDRAVARQVFTKYERGGTPMFKKTELDAAIESGKWPKRSETRINTD